MKTRGQNNELRGVFMINAANLLKVKTIITLLIVFTFCLLTIRGIEVNRDFMLIISNVITYFFAKDSGKDERKEY